MQSSLIWARSLPGLLNVWYNTQMRKFKGISRVIKGPTAHFQRYFWKTVVAFLYVNKISSNLSHLFQDLFWSMQHSKEVSIIFLKNCWWQNSMKFKKNKRYLCWSIFFVFYKVQGDSRFLHKISGYFSVQGAKINSRLFKGFKEPWEPCNYQNRVQDM